MFWGMFYTCFSGWLKSRALARWGSSLCVLEQSHHLSAPRMISLCFIAQLLTFSIHWEEVFVLWFHSWTSPSTLIATPQPHQGSDFTFHERLESQWFPSCPAPACVAERPLCLSSLTQHPLPLQWVPIMWRRLCVAQECPSQLSWLVPILLA